MGSSGGGAAWALLGKWVVPEGADRPVSAGPGAGKPSWLALTASQPVPHKPGRPQCGHRSGASRGSLCGCPGILGRSGPASRCAGRARASPRDRTRPAHGLAGAPTEAAEVGAGPDLRAHFRFFRSGRPPATGICGRPAPSPGGPPAPARSFLGEGRQGGGVRGRGGRRGGGGVTGLEKTELRAHGGRFGRTKPARARRGAPRRVAWARRLPRHRGARAVTEPAYNAADEESVAARVGRVPLGCSRVACGADQGCPCCPERLTVSIRVARNIL